MDIQTKKIMLYSSLSLIAFFIAYNVYKFIYLNRDYTGFILTEVMLCISFYITHLVFSHDINKLERWKKEAIEFTNDGIAIVSDLSLSSTRENGRNTVILSAGYSDHTITFSGISPEFQFKYKIGDEIKIRVHPEDSQRFVLDDLK